MLPTYALLTAAQCEFIGLIGFCTYVANYTALTLRWLRSDSITYFVINFCAASFVLIGLSASFNLAAALIQSFWIVISIIAIAIRLADRASWRPIRFRKQHLGARS